MLVATAAAAAQQVLVFPARQDVSYDERLQLARGQGAGASGPLQQWVMYFPPAVCTHCTQQPLA
jgi:hypothetical protein